MVSDINGAVVYVIWAPQDEGKLAAIVCYNSEGITDLYFKEKPNES